jgi:hypothetical protein
MHGNTIVLMNEQKGLICIKRISDVTMELYIWNTSIHFIFKSILVLSCFLSIYNLKF